MAQVTIGGKSFSGVSRKIAKRGVPDLKDVQHCLIGTVNGTVDQLIVLTPRAMILVLDGGNVEVYWSEVSAVEGNRYELERHDLPEIHILLPNQDDKLTLLEAIHRSAPQALSDRSSQELASLRPRPFRMEWITTLPDIPGHLTVQSKGLVVSVNSASGWTADWKGREAWERALRDLAEQASALGANAVVGACASTFGARGGVTTVVGGDAVGVLLMGTESP